MVIEQAQGPMRAGGRATEAGMAFQAAVATWFAVHILVRMPVGGRFGINNQALPTEIRLETGDGLDDIELSLSDNGALFIQCKTKANLSTGQNAPLAKTTGQLARWIADTKATNTLPDANHNLALLAVQANAPRTLDDLESGCRAFDLGGEWAVTLSQRNQAERGALAVFDLLTTSAWTEHRNTPPDNIDLTDMARIFHIGRFSMDEGGSDWREASQLLGRRLFGDEAAGNGPLRDLTGIMRQLIGSGAPANRNGLLRALRQRGNHDTGAPGFEVDIAKLHAATNRELTRLAINGRLPLSAGVSITRESDAPLLAAISTGSLLVVGEPGAGKSGALVHIAEAIKAAGDTVIFLSVDCFPGIAIVADLAAELELTHSVVETLTAVPGVGRKVLIIDALDAARGGPAETIFAALIENLRERLSDEWSVVASIRTFDLKNGRRFRLAFAGTPPDSHYAEQELSSVRHFLIPRLNDRDLAAVGEAAPELAAILASAPPRLTELLRNIFNLSLAAQLLSDGADSAAFNMIGTQSGLIDAYEDVRLISTPMQQAAAEAASMMINRRRLSVRKVTIQNQSLDEVIRTGVLNESGDLVRFAHHILFDHVTGRFQLAWDDPNGLLTQLNGNTSTALFLAPALRFAVERLWRMDEAEHPRIWELVSGIFRTESIDPVLGNVALRILVENIEGEGDITRLIERIATSPTDIALRTLIRRLVSFAAINIATVRPSISRKAIAWARLSEALVGTGELTLIDAARVLLHALFIHNDLTDAPLVEVFGRTARALLEFAWAASPPLPATAPIRFVGKSFGSDPITSRMLLDRILREPHFSQFADQEASWLAEQIVSITRTDPEFTVEIYAALYGQTISDDATSWFGGQQSRILPLSSNRRQDFLHCRWLLGTKMGEVLAISASYGTRALIDASIGKLGIRNHGSNLVNVGISIIDLYGNQFDLNSWDAEDQNPKDDDLLRHYVRFLRNCDIATFFISVEAASQGYATTSIWARIFGIGAERAAEVGNLLWPLIERPDFLDNRNTSRDAIRFVAAAWSSCTHEQRVRFETMLLDEVRFSDDDERRAWRQLSGHILMLLPADGLELEATQDLRRALNTENLLTPSGPIYRDARFGGEHIDLIQDELRRLNLNIDNGSNRDVLTASDSLNSHLTRTPSDTAPLLLAALWQEAIGLLAFIDESADLHARVLHSAWGSVATAVEHVASSPNYSPGIDGLPEITTMFSILDRLSLSPYPEPHEGEIG